jgi:D-alanine-D-alanine ligase-like ATP-grasp enzyme
MNLFDNSKIIITNKFNLYDNFKKYYPEECNEFMAASWPLNEFIENTTLKNRISKLNEVFIIRPAGTGAFSGRDIYIVNNLKELTNAVGNLKKYEKVLISEYITNPLLLEGKKFHVRIYFMITLIKRLFATRIFDFYEIFTADKKYKQTDWIDKDIHDTHARGNTEELIFPMDITNSKMRDNFKNKYIPKIKDCLTIVSKIIDGKINHYSQTENAFEIFGCDFLITETGQVILMEINDRVGYNCQTTKTTIRLSQLFFNEIIKYILEPLLSSSNSLNKKDWLYLSRYL